MSCPDCNELLDTCKRALGVAEYLMVEVERLRALVLEACDHWHAWMTAEGRGPQPSLDRLAEIRQSASGEGK